MLHYKFKIDWTFYKLYSGLSLTIPTTDVNFSWQSSLWDQDQVVNVKVYVRIKERRKMFNLQIFSSIGHLKVLKLLNEWFCGLPTPQDRPHRPGSFGQPSSSEKPESPNPDNSEKAQQSPPRAPGKDGRDKAVDKIWLQISPSAGCPPSSL